MRPGHPTYRQSPAVLRHGRSRRISTNHRNIYRYRAGWVLHKNFRNHAYRVYFSDTSYRGTDRALAAAMFERDWLDRHRKRILDKLAFLAVTWRMKKVMRTGPLRRHRKTREVTIKDVVKLVVREMKKKGEMEEFVND